MTDEGDDRGGVVSRGWPLQWDVDGGGPGGSRLAQQPRDLRERLAAAACGIEEPHSIEVIADVQSTSWRRRGSTLVDYLWR